LLEWVAIIRQIVFGDCKKIQSNKNADKAATIKKRTILATRNTNARTALKKIIPSTMIVTIGK